jgi:hypothetical protein
MSDMEERVLQLGAGLAEKASVSGEDLATSTQRMIFTFKEPGPFGIRFDGKGVVTKVEAGGQAEALGFMDHDTIMEVAGVSINEKTLIPNLKALGRPGAQFYARVLNMYLLIFPPQGVLQYSDVRSERYLPSKSQVHSEFVSTEKAS